METSSELNGDKSYDLTSFAEDIPVSLSARQENDEEKTTLDTSGRGSEKRLANYDHATQSWKMFGATSLWEESPLLEKLPPSGIARSGELYQRPRWEHLTNGSASSLWPTPTAVMRPMEGNVRLYRAKIEAGEMTEAEAEAILGKSVWKAQGKLPEKWRTPTAADAYTHSMKSSQQKPGSRHSLNLPSAVGGKLNPTWVEWLMGFPLGWTDLEDSETP